jgi:hypothetical protein
MERQLLCPPGADTSLMWALFYPCHAWDVSVFWTFALGYRTAQLCLPSRMLRRISHHPGLYPVSRHDLCVTQAAVLVARFCHLLLPVMLIVQCGLGGRSHVAQPLRP